MQHEHPLSMNFLVATVDLNFNLFRESESEIMFIERIAEHIKRLEEISEGHHFYIDEMAFEALGSKNFPLRFTRVFAKDGHTVPSSRNYQTHKWEELSKIVSAKNQYSPNCQIFFIGGSEFLEHAAKFSKKLLLTVIDREYAIDGEVVDKLPLEVMQKRFKKRRTIHPEMLEKIKQYQEMMRKKSQKTEVEIADNGMKIIKPVTAPIIDPIDTLLNTPDYKFYEYSR